MTERGARWLSRGRDFYQLGPSAVHWHADRLTIEVEEWSNPIPRRLRGRVTLHPEQLFSQVEDLDTNGLHRWGPLAPNSRIEVDFLQPGLRWQGRGYLDSNEGDEPIDRPFLDWDWSRSEQSDGSCAVVYDVRQRDGQEILLAKRYSASGQITDFVPPGRQQLGRTGWRIGRQLRSGGASLGSLRTLEDTPFYARSMVQAQSLGEQVPVMHETLVLDRLVSPVVQWMLPWRMPRRS
jgi:carotenoid 1,2-hydratase